MTKADLWQALSEYPLAKSTLVEKGKSLLRKDNLLDEEIAKEMDKMEKNNIIVDESLNELKNIFDILKQS